MNSDAFGKPLVRIRDVAMEQGLCAEICDVLATNDVVTAVDFSHNNLGDAGAEVVARLLIHNKNIVSVNLSHNDIGDAGLVVICRAARRHATLQSINFAANPVSDAGLSELARLVQLSPCIAEVVLLDTEVTVRGVLSFCEAMAMNTSLLYVSLPYTLGFAVLDEVTRILQRNYGRRHHIDEQVGLAAVANGELRQKKQRREQQWQRVQPNAEEASSRTGSVKGGLSDWRDPVTRSSLLYLALLDKASPAVHSSTPRKSGDRTPGSSRATGVVALPPLYTTTNAKFSASFR